MCQKHHSLTRRRFLKGAALGAASVAVTPILSLRQMAGAANAGIPGRFLVIINLLGGNDGQNTIVPTHLTPYITRRQNINLVNNLPAGAVLPDLAGGFKLHYELDRTKELWDGNDLHIVNKVSYPNPNQSHFTSQDIMGVGIRNNEANGDGRGWLGRFADLYCADPVEPLGVISVGVGRRIDFDSQITAPLIMRDVESFQVDADCDYPADHALRVRTVTDTLATDPVPPADPTLTIFNTNKQAYDLVDRVQQETAGWVDPGTYPTGTAIGRYMRTISQLLHAQSSFGTKVFYTGFGGFDTHSAQHTDGGGSRHENLMRQLDDALGAFADDMKSPAKNLWNDCCVMVISEFGRRNFENGSVGTDHGHGNCFLVAGGRVRGRDVAGGGHTAAPVEADLAPPNNTLPFAVDFRDVYGHLVEDFLGVDGEPLFPDPDYSPNFGNVDLI